MRMNRPPSKPPGLRPPPTGGAGRKVPPTPHGGSLPAAGMSVGTRVGLGVAIGLFSSIAIVIVGAVAVKVLSRGGRDAADADAIATSRPLLAEPIAIDHRPPVPVAAELDEAPSAANLPPVRETPPTNSADSLPIESEHPPQSEPASQPAPPRQEPPKPEETAPHEPPSIPAEAQSPTAPAGTTLALLGELQGLTLALPLPTTLGVSGRVNKLVELSDAVKSVVRGESGITPAPELSLKLLGAEVVFNDDNAVTLEVLAIEKQSRGAAAGWDENFIERTWSIRSNLVSAIGRAPELGRFTIRDGWLAFEWDRSGARTEIASLLKYCLLEVSVGGRTGARERAVCRLGEPEIIPPSAVNLLQSNEKIDLPFKEKELPPAHNLQIDLVFDHFPRREQKPEMSIKLDEMLTTGFFVEEQATEDQPALEVEARFEFEEHPLVSFDVFVHPDRLVEGIEESDRILFLARDTATLKSEHKKRLRLLEHQKRALESEQAQFKAGLQALTNGLRTTSGQDLAELQQQQRLLLARIAQIGDSLADVAKESDQIKLEQEWRTQVTKLLSSLKVDGRVSLQLSIEIDGQQVVIAAPQFE